MCGGGVTGFCLLFLLGRSGTDVMCSLALAGSSECTGIAVSQRKQVGGAKQAHSANADDINAWVNHNAYKLGLAQCSQTS